MENLHLIFGALICGPSALLGWGGYMFYDVQKASWEEFYQAYPFTVFTLLTASLFIAIGLAIIISLFIIMA